MEARYPARIRSSSLGAKLILFSSLLTVGVVSVSLLAVSVQIRLHTRGLLAAVAATHQRMILKLQKRNLEDLVRTSALMTKNPTLRAAIETYRYESTSASPPRSDLLATIQNETEKIAGSLGKDILVVTDLEGKVLAASDGSGNRARMGEDLSPRVIVRRALAQTTPINAENFAVLNLDGQYFQAGCVPIVLQGYIIGTLILGDRLDRGFANRLRESFDSEIVVSLGGRPISSTLALGSGAVDLDAGASSPGGPGSQSATLLLGGEEYVAATLPLGSDDAGRPATLYLLHPLTRVLNQSNRSMRELLLCCGLLAVLVAGFGAWVVSRSVLRPLENFVAFMGSVAQSGDHSRRFQDSRMGVEVRILSEAYNQLMDSLLHHEEQIVLRAKEDLTRLERLKESEKLAALGRMLSGAAHEINNPLTGVVGNAQLLLADRTVGGELRTRIEKVEQGAQRIVALVRKLLRIAHRDSGKRSTIDLNQVIRDTVALRHLDFNAVGMSIVLELSSDPIQVYANELELQQVFLNIVNNAHDALKEATEQPQPMLRIRTSAAEDRASVTFTDNGPGMQSPKQVFDHFYTTKEIGKGTGLGLAISYAIVRDHGGQISAENVPDGGARFRIDLPLTEWKGAEEEAGPPAQEAGFASQQPIAASVLVVDDEPAVIELQATILESLGASVITAATGARAIELLGDKDFDLIVSDLRMPGGVSGQDLFRWVVANRPSVSRVFLFITGDTAGEEAQAFLQESGRPCLLKPFSVGEYVSAVREVLHEFQPTC